MLHNTPGIVLRSIKYGDTSLVTTIFTRTFGIQTYMVQGIRSTKARNNRAGAFQPGVLLDLVVYNQPNKNMQRIREFQAAYIYGSLQEDIVKNSISLFSVEVLLRLLPEHAPLPEFFDIVFEYFRSLDKMPVSNVANFPLYFILQCSRELGFDLRGSYEALAGSNQGHVMPFISSEDSATLNRLLVTERLENLHNILMNADTRLRLVDWCIAFLQQQTQHMGAIKSLAVLRTILH